MESVYLRYTSSTYEHHVSREDYLNVVRPLVMKLRRCGTCEEYFTEDNPCVGTRICMRCLLNKHPDYHFLEVKSVDADGEATYAFIDPAGRVYTIHENHASDLSEDISSTLQQNGFVALPTSHTPFRSTESVKLWASKFTVYGDVARNSVVVLDYDDPSERHHFTFLLYKYGPYKELTKRGEGRVLYERAITMLERTKRGGSYYIDGYPQSRIWDQDIYRVISQLESAMYDISMQFAPPIQPEPIASTEATTAASLAEEVPPSPEETLAILFPEQEGDVTAAETAKPKRGRRAQLALVQNDPELVEHAELQQPETIEAASDQDNATPIEEGTGESEGKTDE